MFLRSGLKARQKTADAALMETSATTVLVSKSQTDKIERHFLLITLTLVVVFGVPVAISLFSGPQRDDTFRGLQSRRGSEGFSRDPASSKTSADSLGVANTVDAESFVLVPSSVSKAVSCDSNVDLGSLSAAHLRLRTSSCGSSGEISILNTTNGFTAEAVPLKGGEVTTDFMDLSEGDNHIEISRTDEAGHKTVQSINVRRAPSSEK